MDTDQMDYAERNADLIPEILQALDFHKGGDTNKRDIVLCNINYKLMERNEEPSMFWKSWSECMKIVAKA